MDFLKNHGEKILFLVLILFLALSVLLGLRTVGGLRDPRDLALTVPATETTLEVESLDRVLERLTDDPPVLEVSMGTFTPEARVICMNPNDRSLIPPDAEICPYCGFKQTVVDRDTDGDGITDSQELAWNMDPDDSTDVYADHDGDGFPTLIEFRRGSDPTSASDTPPLIEFLRLTELQETSVRFELRGTAKLGENYTLQMYWKYPGQEKGSTTYVRTGNRFGRNNEFLAESFTEKRTLMDGRYIDQSVAVIRSGRHRVELGRVGDAREGTMTELAATLELIFGPEWRETVRFGETIELGTKSYKVVDIGRKAVVLTPDADADSETFTITRTTPDDQEALQRFQSGAEGGMEAEMGTEDGNAVNTDDFFR